MASKNAIKYGPAEARQDWEIAWRKLYSNLPPIKPPAQTVQQSVLSTATVNKRQSKKASVMPVVLQQLVSVKKPAGASVAQAETIQSIKERIMEMGNDPVRTGVIKIIIMLSVGFLVMTGIDLLRDWSADKRNNRELADAEVEKKVAETKAQTLSLEKKAIPVTPVSASAGPVYNCNSPESIQAGFHQRKIHTLSDFNGKTITGCTLLSIGTISDAPLAFSGSDYVIEIPVNKEFARYDDKSNYYRCPTAAHPSCGDLITKARNHGYENIAFRVLTTENGTVTITQTKGE
jgi:hypothetical protein